MSGIEQGNPTGRINDDVHIVNVVAILTGRTEPKRHVLPGGDIDSRVSHVMNVTSDSRGANDNACGSGRTPHRELHRSECATQSGGHRTA